MSQVLQTDSANFTSQVLEADVPVLVDFYADWCGPCQAQAPLLETLAADQQDDLRVVKVNVDAEQDLARQFGVRSIPTIVLFQNGRTVRNGIGLHTGAQLNEMVASLNSGE